MRRFITLLLAFFIVIPALTDENSEPDLGSIFGDDTAATAKNESDSPNIDAIFGDGINENSEPALPESADENSAEQEMNEPPWYIVPMDERPSNVVGQIYYYLDYGPRYVQHYLTRGPNTLLEFVEKKTGLPLQMEEYPLEISGFVEGRGGFRTQSDKHEKDASIGELRMQIEAHKTFENSWFDKIKYVDFKTFTFNFKGDIYGDFVTTDAGFDLREANVEFSPFDFADVKIGRQILTWGVGDMLFINDLFPKDWQSFFSGRNDEYLKAPSDALKLSIFNKFINVDGVFVPVFQPDRYITGRRLSYWNPMMNDRSGKELQVRAETPNSWFDDCEWHVRAYHDFNIMDKSYQLAAYFYNGYWKTPAGFNMEGEVTHPRLNVYGASLQGPIWKGIASAEFGFYDSSEDRDGDNMFVDNSQMRWLLGYELSMEPILGKTVGGDLTVGAQYYVEWMMDYDRYRNNLPPGIDPKDEMRQVLTFRITKFLLDQNLRISFFSYFSPTDVDTYIRPNISYKITDYWTADMGANIFIGKEPHTFFGQFARNNNIYFGLRYSF